MAGGLPGGIKICWRPPYSRLNLTQRLCGPLKRTVLAIVRFKTPDERVAAFRKGVSRINAHRDRMGFRLDHEEQMQSKAA